MKSQATKNDLLEIQESRRRQRRDMVLFIPLAVIAMAVMGFSFGVFFGQQIPVTP